MPSCNCFYIFLVINQVSLSACLHGLMFLPNQKVCMQRMVGKVRVKKIVSSWLAFIPLQGTQPLLCDLWAACLQLPSCVLLQLICFWWQLVRTQLPSGHPQCPLKGRVPRGVVLVPPSLSEQNFLLGPGTAAHDPLAAAVVHLIAAACQSGPGSIFPSQDAFLARDGCSASLLWASAVSPHGVPAVAAPRRVLILGFGSLFAWAPWQH